MTDRDKTINQLRDLERRLAIAEPNGIAIQWVRNWTQSILDNRDFPAGVYANWIGQIEGRLQLLEARR